MSSIRPLKLYGKINKNTLGYFIKLNGVRYRFYKKEYGSFENAKKAADEYLFNYSMKKCPNIVEIKQSEAEITVKNTNRKIIVDKKDISKLEYFQWRVRKDLTKKKPITKHKNLVSTPGQKIMNHRHIIYKDGNVFNCKRSNLFVNNQNNKDQNYKDQNYKDQNYKDQNNKNYHNHQDSFPFRVERFWSDGEFYCSPSEFSKIVEYACCCETRLNKTIEIFSDWVYEKTKTFPSDKITFTDLFKDYENLKQVQLTPKDDYIKSSIYGFKLSRKFSLLSRCKVSYKDVSKGMWSLDKIWNTKTTRKELIKTLFKTKRKTLSNYQFYQSYNLRWYIASDFPASIAKFIYDFHKKPIKILDPCSGWGGRLLGFFASKHGTEYVGIDPNSQLLNEIYQPMLKWINNHFPNNKKVTLLQQQAEKLDYTSKYGLEYFDLVFTSPPYFNIEKYSNENTQSYKCYPQKNIWFENFLFKMIRDVEPIIKVGGKIIINIKLFDEDDVKFCNFMAGIPNFIKDTSFPKKILFFGGRRLQENTRNTERLYVYLKQKI
jgi:hypothetical protein